MHFLQVLDNCNDKWNLCSIHSCCDNDSNQICSISVKRATPMYNFDQNQMCRWKNWLTGLDEEEVQLNLLTSFKDQAKKTLLSGKACKLQQRIGKVDQTPINVIPCSSTFLHHFLPPTTFVFWRSRCSRNEGSRKGISCCFCQSNSQDKSWLASKMWCSRDRCALLSLSSDMVYNYSIE